MKLDIGSGPHPHLEPGWEHLDLNPASPHIEYIANCRKLPFCDSSIDMIRASQVLEHVGTLNDAVETIKEWYRVLAKGGCMDVRVPNLSDISKLLSTNQMVEQWRALGMIYGSWKDKNNFMTHRCGFTKEILRHILNLACIEHAIITKEHLTLIAMIHKPLYDKLDNLKICLSFNDKTRVQAQWGSLLNGFLNGCRQNDIDAVVWFHNESPPDDLCERVEIYRDVIWEMERKSSPYMLLGWVEMQADGIDWGIVDTVENNLMSFDMFVVDNFLSKYRLGGFTDKPIALLYCGYDGDIFHHINRDFNASPFRFLYATSPQPRKGDWLVCQAFREEFTDTDSAELLIATGGGGDWERLKNDNSDNQRIIFDHTQRELTEMVNLYAACHILVRPSLSETVPHSVLEAMATGMPCILPRHQSFREFFNDSFGWTTRLSNGYINAEDYEACWYGRWRVPDVGDLRQKMRAAFDNRDQATQKGLRAAVYAKQNLTWEKSIARFLSRVMSIVCNGRDTVCDLKNQQLDFFINA